MKKLLLIYGTRPEAIKMAPLVLARNEFLEKGFELKVAFTGQHRQMVDMIHQRFKIKPEYDLDMMKPGQSLSAITQSTLAGLEEIYKKDKPDGLFVQGDTTSCMAGAISGFYNRIPVFHVEAGLRSHDIWSPYPEEFNRRVVGLAADLHFAPTPTAKDNLIAENIEIKKIKVTGNTGLDALRLALEPQYSQLSDLNSETLEFISRKGSKLILVTAHRRESFGEPIRNILRAIKQLLSDRKDVRFLFFAHLNPEVQKAVQDILSEKNERLLIQPPNEYFGFIRAIQAADIVLTDSGGLQEEAPSLGKPVLVTRETTERPEGVAAGNSMLVGTNIEKITTSIDHLIDDSTLYKKMSQARNPYGDGYATQKILAATAEHYGI